MTDTIPEDEQTLFDYFGNLINEGFFDKSPYKLAVATDSLTESGLLTKETVKRLWMIWAQRVGSPA